MNESTKKLREKNLAKFEDFQPESNSRSNQDLYKNYTLPGFGDDFSTGVASDKAGSAFGADAVVTSPFANDHFNSKLLGVDLGAVVDVYNEDNFYDVFNTAIDFESMKAENQSAWSKLGAGTAQFIGKTVVGTAGNIVGGFYGLGSAIKNEDWSKLYDNDVFQATDDAVEAIEAKNTFFVNQSDGLGLNGNTVKNIADAFSFIASAVASEMIMQTVGNAVGGLGVATAASRGYKYMQRLGPMVTMFEKSAKATTNAKRAERLAQAGLNLGRTVDTMSGAARVEAATNSILAGGRRLLTTTGYEASLEARGASDEVLQSSMASMEQYLETANMTDGEKEQYRATKIEQFQQDADSAGLMTFALNTGMLSVSNAIQFPTIFGNSFLKGVAMGGVVRNGIAKMAQKESARSTLSKGASTLGRYLKTPFTEFMEETGQGVASNYAKNYYEVMLGDQTDAGVLSPRANNIAESMGKALAHTYGTKEGWEEGIIGAIVGGIGLPGLKKHGKGYKGTWNGGIYGDHQQMQQEKKQKEEALQQLNSSEPSDLLYTNKNNATRASVNAQAEDGANMTGNKIEFESVRDNKIFQYTIDRLEKGMSGFIQEDITELQGLASNNIEGYRAAFGKDETFTKEEAMEEVGNFRDKANLYRDAYNKVHKNFNINLMRTDRKSKKLTDNLTYAVANEKIMMDRYESVQNFLFDMKNSEFTKEEITDLLTGSKKYGALASKYDAYVASKNKERGKVTPEEAETRREAVREKMDTDFTNLLDQDKHKLEAELGKLQKKESAPDADPEILEKDKELIANYENAIALKDEFDAIALDEKLSPKITSFDASRSDIARGYEAAMQEFLDKNQDKTAKKAKRAMQEMSKPEGKISLHEMTKFIQAKNAFAEKFNKTLSKESIFDKDAVGYENADQLMMEVFEIGDRLNTATNIAGYLYGFKESPHKALEAVTAAQLWADLDNIDRLATTMKSYMQSGDPDLEFNTMLDEYRDLVEKMTEDFDDLIIPLSRRFDKETFSSLLEEIEGLKANLEEFEKYVKTFKDRTDQQDAANKKSKPKDDTNKKEPKPVDPDKKGETEEDDDLAEHMKGLGEKFGKPAKLRTGDPDTTNESEDPDEQYDPVTNETGKTKKSANEISNRDQRKNKLTIREQSKFTRYQKEFPTLLNEGKFKDKAAATLNFQDEGQFDVNNNAGLKSKLKQDSNWRPVYTNADGVVTSEGETISKHDLIENPESDIKLALAAKSLTVAKVEQVKADGTYVIAEAKFADGKIEVIRLVLENKPNYLESYEKGYAKFLEDSSSIFGYTLAQSLDPDVYTFVRYVPMELKVYDKVLNSGNKFEFEVEPTDTPLYHQKEFFVADDILKQERIVESLYGDLLEDLDKSRDARKEALKTAPPVGALTRTKAISKIKNAYDREERDLIARYESSANNGLSNFEFRFTALRQKYVAKEPKPYLKLRIQNVDLGNIENHDTINSNDVADHHVKTLGFVAKDMELDDIWWGNQHRQYVRIDGKKENELDTIFPFQDLQSRAETKAVYLNYKNQSGKNVPVKMGVSKLSPEFIKAVVDQVDAYWKSKDPENFRVKDTGIPFIDEIAEEGKLTIEKFMQYFMQPKGSDVKDSFTLKNAVFFLEKDGVRNMTFYTGETTAMHINSPEKWTEHKNKIIDRLAENRFFISRKALTTEYKDKDGEIVSKLNKDVLQYFFDKKIITHSFDIKNNVDKIYKRTMDHDDKKEYNKGISLALHNSEPVRTSPKQTKRYGELYSELTKNLAGNSKRDATFETIVDKMIYKTVSRVKYESEKHVKEHLENPSGDVLNEIVKEAVDHTINSSLKLVNDAVSKRPNMKQGVNHATSLKVNKDTDTGFDILLRLSNAFKLNVENQKFIDAVVEESELLGSKSDLVGSFKNPDVSIRFNNYPNKASKLAKTPENKLTSKKQFDAAMNAVEVLEDLINAGNEVHIQYTEDYSENKSNKLDQWKYTVKEDKDTLEKKHRKTRVYAVNYPEGKPEFDEATGQIVNGSVTLQVGTMMRDKKTKEMKVGRNTVTLIQNSETPYPDNNIIVKMGIPFIDNSYNINSDQKDLDVDIERRANIRKLNKKFTLGRMTTALGVKEIETDTLTPKDNSAFVRKPDPNKPAPVDPDSGEPVSSGVNAAFVRKSSTGVHVSDAPKVIDKDVYLKSEIMPTAIKTVKHFLNAYKNYGDKEIAAIRKSMTESFDVDTSGKFLEVINIFRESGDLDINVTDAQLKTFVKTIFPDC